MIPFVITMFLALLGFYYLTVFLHLMGIKIFHIEKINVGKSLIPFFYWFKRKVTK